MMHDLYTALALADAECDRAAVGAGTSALRVGRLQAIDDAGRLVVAMRSGGLLACDLLLAGQGGPVELHIGDSVLVAKPDGCDLPIVLGHVSRYKPPHPRANVTLEATEVLSLKCGEASLEMRADGKVMIKGDDVLIRAKGTQRIRAGNVAIN